MEQVPNEARDAIRETVRDTLAGLEQEDDLLRRAKSAITLLTEMQVGVSEVSRIRREALAGLVAKGWSQPQLAAELKTSSARIGQLLRSGPRPERVLLGIGMITVALGGKEEAGKVQPGPVVAQEDLAAYDHLRQLAKDLGLDTRYEVIPANGVIDVNRDNLIVICGPGLSPLIGGILASDPHLAFQKDDAGWHIIDQKTGQVYRSPMDAGEPADHAYLGRLPRLDGRGTFLYIAGIHAAGAAGVVHWLAGNLPELYAEVGTRKRFSLLISCEVDPDTREAVASRSLTPIYRPEET